jgi:hypothetical protein
MVTAYSHGYDPPEAAHLDVSGSIIGYAVAQLAIFVPSHAQRLLDVKQFPEN